MLNQKHRTITETRRKINSISPETRATRDSQIWECGLVKLNDQEYPHFFVICIQIDIYELLSLLVPMVFQMEFTLIKNTYNKSLFLFFF